MLKEEDEEDAVDEVKDEVREVEATVGVRSKVVKEVGDDDDDVVDIDDDGGGCGSCGGRVVKALLEFLGPGEGLIGWSVFRGDFTDNVEVVVLRGLPEGVLLTLVLPEVVLVVKLLVVFVMRDEADLAELFTDDLVTMREPFLVLFWMLGVLEGFSTSGLRGV